jgi:putative acetyltransferase
LLVIRSETPDDFEAIRQVNRAAFGGEDEATLIEQLRDGGHVIVSLVAIQNGSVAGHILMSRLPIRTAANEIVNACALAPLAVLPEFQRRGIGATLVQTALEACRAAGERIVVVLGHSDYYPKFGFSADLGRQLEGPYSGESWMALELVPGALAGFSGTVEYPEPFSTMS